MSIALRSYKPNFFVIESLDGKNKVDLTNSLLFFDYYEDILSPCVTATAQLMNSSSLYNILPIRGGEKIYISIDTAFGNFELNNKFSMYVYKVGNISPSTTSEVLTLFLISREALTNETSRCQRRYSGNLQTTVTKILKNDLLTDKFNSKNIESTANDYSFIGNNRKPFHVLTWLGPKSVPSSSKLTGVSGSGEKGQAKGVAGFLFYENKEGFNFKSIDSLASKTNSKVNSANNKNIIEYVYTGSIEKNRIDNDYIIANYTIEKNTDLLKSLRVGLYSNITYFYDMYTNTWDLYTYKIKDQINNKLGTKDKISVSEEFGNSISRIMVRSSDRGALLGDGSVGDKNRTGADMAKSYSRYNLLFTQALNMIVPCNINLKAGDIISAKFPKIDISKEKTFDDEQSGLYLIKELRHHFEGNNMVTSLRLIRDSYGLYGPSNKR